ncbi:MAG: hypothetical protein M0Z50_17030 [Planctomycetia bacterium]|nr:hypothetical protein [Planctomycetia bacterium]
MMNEKLQPGLIITYPEAFPITGSLRDIFTKRLQVLFDVYAGAWVFREKTLPEKLFQLRGEMQESIGYPPVMPHTPGKARRRVRPSTPACPSIAQDSDDAECIEDVFSPEELLVWGGLQNLSIYELPLTVCDAGMDMASRVLGISLQYNEPLMPIPQIEDWTAPVASLSVRDLTALTLPLQKEDLTAPTQPVQKEDLTAPTPPLQKEDLQEFFLVSNRDNTQTI